MNNSGTTNWTSFQSNFLAAPLELKLFLIFSFFVTFFGLIILLPFFKDIRELIIPVTGWLIIMPYLANLIVSIDPMVRNKPTNRKITIQYNNILLLAIPIALSLFDLLTWDGGHEDNPYLFRSPWRPIWTIAIPLIWGLVMLSPRIKKYFQFLSLKKQ